MTQVINRQGQPATSASLYSGARAETFTVAANGTPWDTALSGVKTFSIQVKGTGGVATAWDVRLEGSLDGTNYTTILTHTNLTGDAVILSSGAALFPCLYFRSRVASITLGPASAIVVWIMGIQ
jgi:hypothetical protein